MNAEVAGRRANRAALLLVAAAIVAATAALDLPSASNREFWGDGATYYSMAWSLARDLDLRYEARDLERVRAEYPGGPQGLFLKKSAGGLTVDGAAGFPWLRRVPADEPRLYYAKAFLYPLVAAPAVALLGTRGLTATNGVLLAVALVLAASILRRRGFGSRAVAGAAVMLLLTVAPVYLVWPSPEILGLTLATAGLWAWASGRPILSAILFGAAGYLKPPNLLMAAPLGFEPLLPAAGEPLLAPAFARRLAEAARRGGVLVGTAGLFYAANLAVTGEWNYQGGARKTFYDAFPFDARGTTFESAGAWMTTNQLGPLVEEKDAAKVTAQSGPARKRAELEESFFWNLGYFWTGRFGGALGYFFPGVLALAVFLALGPRDRAGWLAASAIAISWIAYLRIIPDNWYGGGGTVGNRYFLNVLPAFLFVFPRRRLAVVAAGSLLAAGVFLAPLLLSPVHHSLRPGEHATRGAWRHLPAELTMLNDLSVFTETWRKKRAFGFVGNAERPADVDAFFLYFTDDGTHGREEWAGRTGFWLRGGERAEVVVRAFDLAPVERIVLRVTGGPIGDTLDARLGWGGERVRLSPGQTREIELRAGRGVTYYDTFLHVLRLRSQRGGRLPDGRVVSAFVEPRLVMGPRFAAAKAP